MPLSHLVRSLRRPQLFTHDVLKPLLGSARAIADRFHNTLPPVLEANVPTDADPLMWTAWRSVTEGTDVRSFLDTIEQREYVHLLLL